MFAGIKKLPIFAAENSSWILDESLKSNFFVFIHFASFFPVNTQ